MMELKKNSMKLLCRQPIQMKFLIDFQFFIDKYDDLNKRMEGCGFNIKCSIRIIIL